MVEIQCKQKNANQKKVFFLVVFIMLRLICAFFWQNIFAAFYHLNSSFKIWLSFPALAEIRDQNLCLLNQITRSINFEHDF